MIEITVPSAPSATARGCAAIVMPLSAAAFIATASRSQPITSKPLLGEPRLDGAAHAAQSDEADLHRCLRPAGDFCGPRVEVAVALHRRHIRKR